MLELGLALFAVALYFAPFFIAKARKKRNAAAIGLLTLLLGWTIIGWIGALIWSATAETPTPRPESP